MDHNTMLLKSVDLEELDEVVKQMAADKALDLDGFTMHFFHSYWDLLAFGKYRHNLVRILLRSVKSSIPRQRKL